LLYPCINQKRHHTIRLIEVTNMVEDIREIDIDKLDANPFQPRLEHPEGELKDLGRSIKENGMLEPIIVRPHPTHPDRYQICVGERRVRACKLVGITKVLAIVRNLTDEQMAEYGLVENLQRKNLNPIEEARGFRTLQERFDWTQEQIAKEVGHGLTRDIVAQRLRLLTFPPELQESVSRDTITPTHAESVARLVNEPSLLKEAIHKVVEQELTTSETEELVSELMEKETLHKRIRQYLTSEEHILGLQYLFIRMTLDPSDTGCCPVCDHLVIYEESNLQRIVCESCGWEFGIGYGPLFELVEHIRKLRRARKRQEPASEQSKS